MPWGSGLGGIGFGARVLSFGFCGLDFGFGILGLAFEFWVWRLKTVWVSGSS